MFYPARLWRALLELKGSKWDYSLVLGRQEESQGQHVRPFFGKKIEHTQGFASATKSWPNIQAIYPSNSTQAVSPSNKATTVGHKAGSRSIFRWERFLKPSELSSRSNEDEKFGLNQSPPTASPRPLFTHYQVRSPEALRQSTYHVNHSNPGTYPKPTEPIPILHFQDDPAIRFQEKFMTDKEIQTMDPVRNATRSPGLETSLFSWQHLETRELDSENGRTCSSSKAAGRGTKATKKKAMTKTRRPQKDPVIICQPTSFNPEEHAKFFRTTDGPTKRDADGTVGGRKADVGDRTCGLCNLPNSKMRVISNRLSSNEVVEMMAHDGQESGDTVILADQSYQQPQDQMIDQIASPSSEYPGSFSGYPYYTTTSAERNLARSASHHTLPTATGRQEAKRPSSLSIIPTPEKANTTQSNANLAPGPSIASDGSIPSFSQSSQSDIPLPRPLNYTKRPTSVTPKIPAIPAPLKSLQHPTQNSLRALTPQEQESSKDRATLLTAPVSQPPFKMTRACRELLLGHRSSLLCHEEEEEDAYEPVIKISKEEKAMRNMMLTPNRLIPGQPLIAPTWKQKCDEWGWNMAVVGMDKELLAVEIEEQQALVEDALKRLEELKVSWKEVVEEEKKLLESEEARGEGGDAEGERQ